MIKNIITLCACLLITSMFSQEDASRQEDNILKKEKIASGVYKFETNKLLMNGETTHFSNMELIVIQLNTNDSIHNFNDNIKEQIFIVKDGEIEVTIGENTKTIGPNSVAFVLPNDKIQIINTSNNPAIFYHMNYSPKALLNLDRGKNNAGSFIMDFDKLAYNEHDKGGIRNYFHTKTAAVEYYEMHLTNLNAGIKSHEPHTHHAAEIVLMIDGNTQMEIGDGIYQANKGDVYFLASDIPHAIENIGNKQCMYFAFQWD
ncbi:(S)-ureidoglycine aminohydrolase [Flaviramulus basaltis]|uniref:(S)-ureidoglycine aminohydrolase n=1 Tax=Flaviramulus basaltis TaxID=369401 RepID=A0A1K2IH79_9FLAO|nr:cupin domain-containing protein [Flaviramulus basaltis]SFZ91654.1 (S)-ureidoglycine aminohydrolase [Flaviramulus basaltis]